MVPAHPIPAAPGQGPDPATAVTAVTVATSTQLADNGTRADDPCAAGCATQARPRHDPLGERLDPPDRHATDAGDVADGRPAVGARTAAAPAPAPLSLYRSAHDRGRAPPALSGT
ncbi:hypothetical protein [Streptomyces sp. Y7]|uniref:hypothetical protein n=1 Tax=Streptomyces sp. Y7 TaxID=3342392 RepID=UPI003720A3E5